MEHNKNAVNLIALVANNTLRRCLFDLLEVDDLVALLSLNKELKKQLLENTPIANRIYYLTFLKPREMFTYAFCDTKEYKSFEAQKVDGVLSSIPSSFIGTVPIMKKIREELSRNLRMLVSQQNAVEMVGDVFETMTNPSMPIPSLRKETVGDYCNSAIQLLMAELNWKDNSFKIEEEPYRALKIELLSKHQQILEELRSNRDILVKIRFQSEFIDSYQQTNSPFLNIITLILVLIDYHLESMKKYLDCYKICPAFQFLSQFTKRYNTFRDMVLLLQEKLGFTMELFTKAFNFLVPELQIYPGCSLWRSFMKKWVNKMKPYEELMAQGFAQVLIHARQKNFEATLEDQQKLQECSPKLKSNYIMKRTLLQNKYQICSQEFQIIESADPEASTVILNEYIEYLVDASANEYSIHWCQSSSQRLSSIYNTNENLVLQSTKQLYGNWRQMFEQTPLLRQVYEKDVDYLRNILKPNTLSKVIQQANVIISETFKQSQKLIKGEFQKLDDRIRFLNQKRMIPLELEQEYQQFFDFDKTISLDKIESIIAKIGKIQKWDNVEKGQVEKAEAVGEGVVVEEGP